MCSVATAALLCVGACPVPLPELEPCQADADCPGGFQCDVDEGFCHSVVLGDGGTGREGGGCECGDCSSAGRVISAGGLHTCVVMADGQLRCWGDNDYGQLGFGAYYYGEERTTAVPVCAAGVYVPDAGFCVGDAGALLQGMAAVAAGGAYTCALDGEGRARCWGANSNGQLGSGSSSDGVPNPVDLCGPTGCVPAAQLSGIEAFSAGARHACLVSASLEPLCWGYNGYFQLGNGDSSAVAKPDPVCASGVDTTCVPQGGVARIAAGADHTCMLLDDNAVRCWGRNNHGQLGNGGDQLYAHPTDVCTSGTWSSDAGTCFAATSPPLSGAVALSMGNDHSCALMDDRTVRCWGSNGGGRLGHGRVANESSAHPVTVCGPGGGAPCDPLTDVVAIEAGGGHSCALTAAGEVYCWGVNSRGQLGNGTSDAVAQAAYVCDSPGCTDTLGDVVAISAGGQHTCAVLGDGTVRCWGDNLSGQLGIASLGSYRNAPVPTCGGRLDGGACVPLVGAAVEPCACDCP